MHSCLTELQAVNSKDPFWVLHFLAFLKNDLFLSLADVFHAWRYNTKLYYSSMFQVNMLKATLLWNRNEINV